MESQHTKDVRISSKVASQRPVMTMAYHVITANLDGTLSTTMQGLIRAKEEKGAAGVVKHIFSETRAKRARQRLVA